MTDSNAKSLYATGSWSTTSAYPGEEVVGFDLGTPGLWFFTGFVDLSVRGTVAHGAALNGSAMISIYGDGVALGAASGVLSSEMNTLMDRGGLNPVVCFNNRVILPIQAVSRSPVRRVSLMVGSLANPAPDAITVLSVNLFAIQISSVDYLQGAFSTSVKVSSADHTTP